MTTTRKQYSPRFKPKVALEAIRGERTLNQLASQFRVHPVQVGHWRKTAMEHLEELFVEGRRRQRRDDEVEKEVLYEEIGRLKVELDWTEKKSWPARVKTGAGWWSRNTPRSACAASASCWTSPGRACTTGRRARARRICY